MKRFASDEAASWAALLEPAAKTQAHWLRDLVIDELFYVFGIRFLANRFR